MPDNSGDADNKADKADADANKLDSVSKLAGHRIGVVTGNAATPEVLDVVLSHYGVPLNQVQVSLIDPSHIAEAVKALQVDVTVRSRCGNWAGHQRCGGCRHSQRTGAELHPHRSGRGHGQAQ
jgi:hypothetical protein